MKKISQIKLEESSFRDPDGFLFFKKGVLYRQINQSYKKNYDLFLKSGLYQKLVDQKLLILHEEVDRIQSGKDSVYKIIKPKFIPFISYPYEWSYSQLKDAALLTLKIQKEAVKYGMSLKDCSAYNIQFLDGKPIFIDTLSFEKLPKGKPWIAYRQFCQHFLALLSLMSLCDIRLGLLMRDFIDGMPLDLTSKLLPSKSRFNTGLYLHIHLHAKTQQKFADISSISKQTTRKISIRALLGLIESLEATVLGLKWRPEGTEWAKYYEDDSYIPSAIKGKLNLVKKFVRIVKPKNVWDIGANNGLFSRMASDQGIFTVASDIDPAAVEQNYLLVKKQKEKKILPLVIDLTNPSPDIGWANNERKSFISRGPVDMVFALALIHHLAISNNLPFCKIAQTLSNICKNLIIEFVPKTDKKVKKLLSTREDIFPDYHQEGFEKAFSNFFKIKRAVKIKNSTRLLYLMTKK